MTPRFLSLTLAGSLALSTPLFAQDASTVLARVGGTEITLGHLIDMQSRLPDQYRNLDDQVLFDGLLDQLVQQTLLADQVSTSTDTAQKLRIENETRTMLTTIALDAITAAATTEEAIAADYAANYSQAPEGFEWNASHILVETEEEALALIETLDSGADFAELAKEKSTGPSGSNGGQLGWFSTGQMVQPFEEAVQSLEVGAVSPPVQTQFGWHVVRLNDERPLQPPSLAEVRSQITDKLSSEAVSAAIEALETEDAVTYSSDGVDPALIRQTDLLGD